MVSTVLNEAVQGDRDPVNRKLDPRLEGRVFQAERIRSEKALGGQVQVKLEEWKRTCGWNKTSYRAHGDG